jgi:hypothetical protein
MGVSCFIGIALLHGHTLKDIKLFLDIEPSQVEVNVKFFRTQMQEYTQRLTLGQEVGRISDTRVVVRRKSMLTMNALRLHSQLKGGELVPITQF